MKPLRAEFIRRCLLLTGTPYLWGGRNGGGLDCSGLVAVALHEASKGAVDLRGWWTDKMWAELPAIAVPLPGDLVFYGGVGPDVQHVMVVLYPEGSTALPEGLLVGASGGNRGTTTLREAARTGAQVDVKTAVRYRPDSRGFRSLAGLFGETGAKA